jgi:hypothetical protein
VQGRLRNEPLSFDIDTECACCTRPIRFRMDYDLRFELKDPECDPLFFIPLVDFTKLKASSIIDHF